MDQKNRDGIKKIYVCSPFKGRAECKRTISEHEEIAREICSAIASFGVMPIAPHLFFPQFLDDDIPKERDLGCSFGLELLNGCDALVVYGLCCGISDGMLAEIQRAKRLDLPVLEPLTLSDNLYGDFLKEFLLNL